MKAKAIFIYSLFLFSTVSAQIQVTDVTADVHVGFRSATDRMVDIIVIHSTHCIAADTFSINCVIEQFKEYNVSAHYVIGREGQIYQLVKETDIAFHAGKSELPGTQRKNLNASSIGIEIINTPYTPPTDKQYEALINLVKDIQRRYEIKYIVRHSDIAPERKIDPWLFNWEMFLNKLKE